jgi:cysteine-S-conjugate beta-lyase
MKFDFDQILSREGTFSIKYEERKRIFGVTDIEPFWVADMDLPTPPFICEALQKRIDHPMFGYTQNYEQIFNSICWWMENIHSVKISKDSILLSPSVVTSICMAIDALTEYNDEVLIFSPVYGPFFSCVRQNKRKIFKYPLLVREGKYWIDFEQLEKMSENSRIKLVLLCSPHNPGGRVWPKEQLLKLINFAQKRGAAIFSDEIHSDLVYSDGTHNSLLAFDEANDNSVVAHSIGKTFNSSGLMGSFMVTRNKLLKQKIFRAMQRYHITDINVMAKIAMVSAFSKQGEEYLKQLKGYIKENIDLTCQKLNNISTVRVMKPEATYLVWCDFSKAGEHNEVMERLLSKAQVGLSEGTFFGSEAKGWFRLNCAHPRSKLLNAVDRIANNF